MQAQLSPSSALLVMPIGALLRPVRAIEIDSSISRAAEEFKEHGFGLLPVSERGEYAGCLRQSDVLRAISEGISIHEPISTIMRSGGVVVRPSQSGAEALRLLHDSGEPALIVIDQQAQVLGIVTPVDLLEVSQSQLTPRPIGGMATPFGVYLTNGAISGGAPKWALVATGMLLFGLFFAANSLGVLLYPVLSRWLTESAVQTVLSISTFLLFMAGLRLIPLSGTHAAEHMTVHAIERGEPLVPEVVSRMPRVHPRCGTNLAAGAALFLGIMGSEIVKDMELRLMLAAFITLIFWRPLGSALQYYVTTKPPNRKQLESGIRAGKDLIRRYQHTGSGSTSVLGRLWNSGLPEVILGSFVVQFFILGIYYVLGQPAWLGVYL